MFINMWDICQHVSTQNLIYSSQFQPLETHNMPKLSIDRSFEKGEGHSFPTLLPPKVKQTLGRPRQRHIKSQFPHKRAVHSSRCNRVGHDSSKCTNL